MLLHYARGYRTNRILTGTVESKLYARLAAIVGAALGFDQVGARDVVGVLEDEHLSDSFAVSIPRLREYHCLHKAEKPH
jgi:hypothetical protein